MPDISNVFYVGRFPGATEYYRDLRTSMFFE